MSDAALHEVHLAANAVYGTTQANPAYTELRKTGCSLKVVKNTLTSAELKGNRMPSDVIHGTKVVNGELSGELSYGTYDRLIEGALCGTWSTPHAPLTGNWEIQPASLGAVFVGGPNASSIIPVGQIVKVKGFTPEIDGFYRLASAVQIGENSFNVVNLDGSIPVWGDDGSDPSIDPAGNATITPVSMLKPALVRRDFRLLRKFTDQSVKPFYNYENCEINTMAVGQNAEGLTTITFGVVGKDGGVSATAPAGSTWSPPTTSLQMTGFNGFVEEGGVEIPCTEMTFNLDNGIAPEYVIGSRAPRKHAIGTSVITGQAVVPFEGPELVEKFYNEETGCIAMFITDLPGNGYLFINPRVTYTDAGPDVSGAGTIPLTVPYSNLEFNNEDYHAIICRVPATA